MAAAVTSTFSLLALMTVLISQLPPRSDRPKDTLFAHLQGGSLRGLVAKARGASGAYDAAAAEGLLCDTPWGAGVERAPLLTEWYGDSSGSPDGRHHRPHQASERAYLLQL